MHFAIIFRILGILLMLFSLTHLIPLGVSLAYDDGVHLAFISSFCLTFVIGLIVWSPVYKARDDLRTRDGFLITALFWLVLGTFGSMPFILDEHLKLSVTDAVFESISGLTTTGGTVITGLDDLPKSILFYRQQLQWLGGIGIIVIAVAILPMLGIGGMQLYRAETPGPIKDSKLTPRITETAKWLFFIYAILTSACAIAYRLAGMTWFDAISHSFSTVAIGGFSTHDASMGYFQNPTIWMICCFFMFISGLNFGLHFLAWRKWQLKQYIADSEAKFYFFYILMACLIVVPILVFSDVGKHYDHPIVEGIFQVVSMATTTGFATTDFSAWPTFLPFMLIYLSFIGGCAGSTGGGVKVIRIALMLKMSLRELQQLVHPKAVIPVKLKRKPVDSVVLSAVWSFIGVYLVTYIALVLALQATGMDHVSANSATIAMINNLGPALGTVSANYGHVEESAKWIMCLGMLLGRLEIFTLLVLFTPAFWRR
ncbi:Trk system potassium uptake protein TrkH [BD1-7 clade bacterium]|uniref:Trk system potassium uptake protein n=1 Tax=BD1-7 clade bacterium TaxID=2029982 RepID=A0A5S9N0G2_9GAMM|nr:Trk system potassium uptake protein TrkH [BD1-7 clade bacterium]